MVDEKALHSMGLENVADWLESLSREQVESFLKLPWFRKDMARRLKAYLGFQEPYWQNMRKLLKAGPEEAEGAD